MKPKLKNVYENDTDFKICIYEVSENQYVVTRFDSMKPRHEGLKRFNTLYEAIDFAVEENKKYIKTI